MKNERKTVNAYSPVFLVFLHVFLSKFFPVFEDLLKEDNEMLL